MDVDPTIELAADLPHRPDPLESQRLVEVDANDVRLGDPGEEHVEPRRIRTLDELGEELPTDSVTTVFNPEIERNFGRPIVRLSVGPRAEGRPPHHASLHDCYQYRMPTIVVGEPLALGFA